MMAKKPQSDCACVIDTSGLHELATASGNLKATLIARLEDGTIGVPSWAWQKAATAVTDLRQQTAYNFDCCARTVVLPVVPICRGSAFLIVTPNQRQIHRYPVPLERGVSRSSRTLGAGCGGRGWRF
jgi:hypothetical protein